jgi:hypothetical protein
MSIQKETGEKPMSLNPGRYRHFKGKYYEVVGCAKHSETEEEFVVYRDESQHLWVRPLAMFVEQVLWHGQMLPRFAYVEPASEAPS